MVPVRVRSWVCPGPSSSLDGKPVGCGYRWETTDARADRVAHRHGDQEVPMTRQADTWR